MLLERVDSVPGVSLPSVHRSARGRQNDTRRVGGIRSRYQETPGENRPRIWKDEELRGEREMLFLPRTPVFAQVASRAFVWRPFRGEPHRGTVTGSKARVRRGIALATPCPVPV